LSQSDALMYSETVVRWKYTDHVLRNLPVLQPDFIEAQCSIYQHAQ